MKQQIVIAVMLLLSISCRKNLTVPSQTRISNAPSATGLNATAVSVGNPFDSIGVRHNILLDSVWNYVQRTEDTSAAGKKNFIVGYFKQCRPDDAATAIAVINNGPQTAISGLKEILAGKNITQQTSSLLYNLMETIDTTASMSDFAALIQKIKMLEAKAMAASIPSNEQQIVLQATAVAKYSASFWHDKVTNFPAPARSIKGIIRFIASVHADTLGAIYGTFEGDSEGEAEYQSALWVWYVDAFL